MNLLSLRQPQDSLARERLCDPDSALVARARSGQDLAFGLLVERHRERVLNLAFSLLGSRSDAEDAAQEAFVRAYESLPRFRGEAAFATWLHRITVNVCLARLRRTAPCAPSRDAQADDDEPQVLEVADAHDLARSIEARAHVQAALATLSPVLRAALVLREMQGLSYQEVALALDVPVGTVRSRLSEARRLFRQAWQSIEAGDSP